MIKNAERKSGLRLRYDRLTAPSVRNWGEPSGPVADELPRDVILDCGWGRLIFAHTFRDPAAVAQALMQESPGKRDIALYLRDPHVVLAQAPQELFLDPSHTYRLWFDRYRPATESARKLIVRRIRTEDDTEALNRIFAVHRMVPIDPHFPVDARRSRKLTFLIAVDSETESVTGGVIGVDHYEAFGDPEGGSSLWCLAVDPQAPAPGIGETLVRHLAEHYLARGRAFMDLSVMHDNAEAIALYEKLGFERVPVFCLKCKNSFNEPLYIGRPDDEPEPNPYAKIIIDEARRRGIAVRMLPEGDGWFELSLGGRTIVCRESLSELTSAVAMSRCDDKSLTRAILTGAGLTMPAQRIAGDAHENASFLAEHSHVVVKPARGEQGAGVSVDLTTAEAVEAAIDLARDVDDRVLLEAYVQGDDLRIIVIDGKVVAAAIRRPPKITGDGKSTALDLLEKKSRRRAAATGGESCVPIDDETRRVLGAAGYRLEDILPEGATVTVRKTANLHTGGTIHDVTDRLHPDLKKAALDAAQALEIPVVGLDFIVPSIDGEHYAIIEANERPGLANHEPQPTAERFIDLLFPHSSRNQSNRT